MMNQSLISIIIPTYNRAHLISETLDSISAQTYTNWECIIVDDGSTDNTKEIINNYIQEDNRFQYHQRPSKKQKGANACRNYGFEMSKGEYINWFDSDDVMHSSKIEDKVSILKNHDYDFVVCEGIEFQNEISNTFNKWDTLESSTPLIAHITGLVKFSTNGPMFRRWFLEKSTLFNKSIQRKQEWEFYSRLLMMSTNYYPLKKVLYYIRIHQNSINGENSNKTLVSRIKANNLVFKNLKKNKEFLKSNFFLRRHFLNKYIYNFRLMLISKKYISFYYILKGIFLILNWKLFFEIFKNFIKKPIVLTNSFKTNNN